MSWLWTKSNCHLITMLVRISTHGWASLIPESCMQSMGLQKLETRDSYAYSVVPLGKSWLEVRFQKAGHLWLCSSYTAQKYLAKGETGGSTACPLLANTLAVLCLGAQPCLLSVHFSASAQRESFFLICRKAPYKQAHFLSLQLIQSSGR